MDVHKTDAYVVYIVSCAHCVHWFGRLLWVIPSMTLIHDYLSCVCECVWVRACMCVLPLPLLLLCRNIKNSNLSSFSCQHCSFTFLVPLNSEGYIDYRLKRHFKTERKYPVDMETRFKPFGSAMS